ncbi:MAG: hypothetical protein KF796_20720 [Ramlibacter sp.]|nr:hypothetical protein [Ramlibacter sp.]
MAKLTVHAGDFGKGEGSVGFGVMLMPPTKWWHQWGDKIALSSVAEVELASEDSVKRLGGSVGWGAAGALALGPVGLLAGLLLGGNGKECTFVCRLHDGRGFLATVDSKSYTQIQAATWHSGSPRPESGES